MIRNRVSRTGSGKRALPRGGAPAFLLACLVASPLAAQPLLPEVEPPPIAPADAPEAAQVALEEVRRMAVAGARELALRFVDRLQPSRETSPEGWRQWELLRFDLLADLEAWGRLEARLERDLEEAEGPFRLLLLERLAGTRLARGDGDGALEPLRLLLWGGEAVEDHRMRRWRRLVIRAHLARGALEDARRAMLRYRGEFSDRDAAERLLEARVLLSGGRWGEAERLLVDVEGDEAQALSLLAHLRNGLEAPASVRRVAEARAAREGLSAAARARYLYVAAEAARLAGEGAARIAALERLLAAAATLSDPLFRVEPEDLWNAWEQHGRLLGNRLTLLLGDDASWYREALNRLEKSPGEARALLTVIVAGETPPQARRQAHAELAGSLAKEPGGTALLRRLYDGVAGHGWEELPLEIRYRLVDEAIRAGRLTEASAIMGGLERPPAKADPFFWQLRRARILAYGGRAGEAARVLDGLLSEGRVLTGSQGERFLQVIFDLQAAGLHQEVIDLLRELRLPASEAQLKREVLYWMADSWKALGRPLDAARFYLRSATLFDGAAMDPWAQTARYQAADQLVAAGFREDARRIYRHLLEVTRDKSRRIALRNRLQRLDLGRDGAGEAESSAP